MKNRKIKKLSIIILTYNSTDDILNCIESVYQTSDIHEGFFEIIVVDNSSVNVFNFMDKLIKYKYGDKIKIFHNSENRGYGHGNNVGVKYATSDVICIMNPDVILQDCKFSKVLNYFSKDIKLALVGGKQLGGLNMSFWIRPEFEFFIFTTPICLFLNRLNVYFQKFFFLSGALLFIDKKKFENIGMFDDHIFLYCEEADITKRFLDNGFKTKYDRSIIYRHLIDGRDASDSAFEAQMDSMAYYFKKYKYDFSKFVQQRRFSYKLLYFISKVFNKKVFNKKSIKNLNLLKKHCCPINKKPN